MIEEILRGLAHWTAYHDGIDTTVHSSFVIASGTLIDPMLPSGGVEEVGKLGKPQRIVLSNRHHYRQSTRFVERYGCSVLCHEAGLYEFTSGEHVQGFAFGDELAKDVTAVELGAICPEETTLLIDVGKGALSFADGLTRDAQGGLCYMPDYLLGDDPEAVKAGLTENLRKLLGLDFDALLFAHAEPVPSGGKAMLEGFLS